MISQLSSIAFNQKINNDYQRNKIERVSRIAKQVTKEINQMAGLYDSRALASSKSAYRTNLLQWYGEVAPMGEAGGPLSVENLKGYIRYVYNYYYKPKDTRNDY